MRRVVVTGIGAITPAGIGIDQLWKTVEGGQNCLAPIDTFDASGYVSEVAGQSDFAAEDHLPARFVKRTDRFTHMAVVAARQALADSGISIGHDVAAERVGVMIGNILGGWGFAERELRKLWIEGPRSVSPYQATAWFPAAAQGNICIELGVKGPARTFVADRASGAYALIRGVEAVQRGHADVVLAGGVEAPLSPYGWLCLQTSGLMAPSRGLEPSRSYRPFDARHSGSVFGEGCALLTLESEERALSRGADILGEIAGWGVTTDGYMPYYTVEPTGTVLAGAMKTALRRAGIGAEEVGAVFAHGSGIPVEDVTEAYAVRDTFTASGPPAVTAPKSLFGHLLGAAAPVDVAVSLVGMRRSTIPATANLRRQAPGIELDLVRDAPRQASEWNNTLVVSRGLGGLNACVVVRKP